MNSLLERIQQAMKDAMRAKQQAKLTTIRLMLSEIKKYEIDQRTGEGNVTLDDEQIFTVLNKMVKQRRDSVEQFQAANRQDLADKEATEITVIEEFLPTPLSEAEVDTIIKEAIAAVNATSMRDMGTIMTEAKTKIQGRADMKAVSAKVKAHLATL